MDAVTNNARPLVNDEELERFQDNVEAFLRNEIDAERFQSIRLQQGVYGQRQDGVNMIRVKIPGGRLSPAQLEACADVLENYSQHDVAHVTTRQDIQIHYVPIENSPAALKDLARAGLTTREACNNTVRNISCCPLAGVCPSERVDITRFLDLAVRYFLRHPLTQHMPRKFKISFSACETDCAQGMIHDLAVIAVKQDDRFGFRILAGGGLGHKPRQAITVEDFIPEEDLIPCMEAILAVHNRYSDRKRRAKARIKFLVERFGAEGFIEKYREELERARAAVTEQDSLHGDWQDGAPSKDHDNPGAPRRLLAQKQAGLNIFPINLKIGDIDGPRMRGIAALMYREKLSDIRATQDQNLIIVGVPDDRVEAVREGLADLGLAEPTTGDDIVACPGTSTCRLGITSSKTIGSKVSGGDHDLRIRASGCHNGCAQPETGDIGIYGEGKRLHGKLVPHYQMYIGGDGRAAGAIAIKGPSVPAMRVEQAITRLQETYTREGADGETFFQWSQRHDTAYFKDLLADITAVAEHELAGVMSDHGDENPFKVVQFGGGECAGAAQETVAANFADAANERNYRNGFLAQRKPEASIECAQQICRLVGGSLLFLAGQKPVDDLREAGRQIEQALQADPTLGTRLVDFTAGLEKLADDFDEAAYRQLTEALDRWTVEAGAACQDIDRQLDLSGSLSSIKVAGVKKN